MSSQIRTKLRDWAVWQARAGCYSSAALSLNDSKTLYSGAGSVQNLRETAADTRDIIRELKEGLWIGRGTRYVTVDFTIYNANVNLFCVIKLRDQPYMMSLK